MNIAFLGTGLMGAPMARRLIEASHRVTVWNRTRARAEPLARDGGHIAASAVEAVAEAEVVIVMLSDHAAIEETLFGEAPAALGGRILLQMGTITPGESRALEGRVSAQGGAYLEAPVLGSIPEATGGTLQVMVGGDARVLERCRTVLVAIGTLRHVGPVGHAATIKLALNQMIATMTSAFSLSLGLLEKSSVSSHDFREILKASALSAPTFEKKLPRMLASDFTRPNFPLKHLRKDLDLFLATAREVDLDAAFLDALAGVLRRGVEEGSGELDYSVLYRLFCPREVPPS